MNPARMNARRAIASAFAFAAIGAATMLTGCASASPDDAEGDGEATSEDPLRQTANNA